MHSGKELAELYRHRFEREFLPRKMAIWRVLCRHYFQRLIEPDAVVIDMACGYGEFINNIRAAQKFAIDVNDDSSDHLAPDVEFHLLPANRLSEIGEGRADVVFTSNFLEHLPDKATLNEVLEHVHKALKPGGQFLILGPNLRYLPGQYWDFYDHHLGLTHLSLSEALMLKGFQIERCIDKFLPYTTQGALPTHPMLVRLYLKFPIAWRLLGKQFFIVAKKPR
ncbi:class I SAM-dependent methyltransferase [Pseudomonadota bacterium]